MLCILNFSSCLNKTSCLNKAENNNKIFLGKQIKIYNNTVTNHLLTFSLSFDCGLWKLLLQCPLSSIERRQKPSHCLAWRPAPLGSWLSLWVVLAVEYTRSWFCWMMLHPGCWFLDRCIRPFSTLFGLDILHYKGSQLPLLCYQFDPGLCLLFFQSLKSPWPSIGCPTAIQKTCPPQAQAARCSEHLSRSAC